jgi:hypothetical protein
VKHTTTLNYRLEQAATALAALGAAALLGWAIALLLAAWGDSLTTKLTPWKPFALLPVALDAVAANASAPAVAGASRLVGVAGDRAYFLNGAGSTSRSISLAAGELLPSGEKLLRVERDAVVLLAAGQETRVTVFGVRAEPVKVAKVSGSSTAANTEVCRLAGADRSAAIFIQPAMVKALSAERATFARMFELQALAAGGGGSGGSGIRAKGTGGTTSMFAILDGDLLLRVDGAPIKSSDAIITEVLARVERGGSVVVEGERAGAPRRWVYAPASCALTAPAANGPTQPSQSGVAKSSSKSSG